MEVEMSKMIVTTEKVPAAVAKVDHHA